MIYKNPFDSITSYPLLNSTEICLVPSNPFNLSHRRPWFLRSLHSLTLSSLKIRHFLIRYRLLRIRLKLSHTTDLPPAQGKQAIHALQAAPGSLRNEEPGPDTANDGQDREEPEAACGTQSSSSSLEEHDGDGTVAGVLVREMKTHDHGAAHRADSQRVDLGVQEILHAVPAHSPAEA